MDVGRIQGHTNVDRKLDRPAPVDDRKRSPQAESKTLTDDVAHISQSGRDIDASIAELTERAKTDSAERAQIVADAQARLERGDLDDPAVYRAVAERMLRS